MSILLDDFKMELEAKQSELRVKLTAAREEVIDLERELNEVVEALTKLENV